MNPRSDMNWFGQMFWTAWLFLMSYSLFFYLKNGAWPDFHWLGL